MLQAPCRHVVSRLPYVVGGGSSAAGWCSSWSLCWGRSRISSAVAAVTACAAAGGGGAGCTANLVHYVGQSAGAQFPRLACHTHLVCARDPGDWVCLLEFGLDRGPCPLDNPHSGYSRPLLILASAS